MGRRAKVSLLVRMAIINKTRNNQCWRGGGGKGALVHWW